MGHSILVIEDTKFFGVLVVNQIKSRLGIPVEWARTLAEAEQAIADAKNPFTVALADINLPDASGDEVVSMLKSKEIPCIVFSGEYEESFRERIWAMKVVDYVVKKGAYNLDYLMSITDRICKNGDIRVLVVDDSAPSRSQIADLLRVHRFQVLTANNGEEGLRVFNENDDIKLIIVDYDMPEMDGFRMTGEIRKLRSKEELVVIGISALENRLISARFIKTGANDFIAKPFLAEEFYCRVNQNLQVMEYVQALKNASVTDYLTTLYNRRHLFEVGEKLHANAKRNNLSITVALMDIDHFKKVNDTHGHDAGDLVLKEMGTLLSRRFRKMDVVARYGGEEFCIIAPNVSDENAPTLFEDLRKSVEAMRVESGSAVIRPTISIGVCCELKDSLEQMINAADAMLYEAKAAGRNRVKTTLTAAAGTSTG